MAKSIIIDLPKQPLHEAPTRSEVEEALSGKKVLSSSVSKSDAGWQILAEVEEPAPKPTPKPKKKAEEKADEE